MNEIFVIQVNMTNNLKILKYSLKPRRARSTLNYERNKDVQGDVELQDTHRDAGNVIVVPV